MQLTLQETDGTPLLPFNYGAVVPGSTTAAKLFKLKNTGDATVPAAKAWVEQAATADGAFQVTIGNVAITGTSPETATTLPSLAIGASLSGSAIWSNPPGSAGVPVDTGTLRITLY